MAEKARSVSPAPTADKLYLAFAVVGLVVPFALLFRFIVQNGPNVRLFVDELFGTYGAAIAMADLVLSSVVFWAWLFSAGERNRVSFPWLYVALNLCVGLCFALPLYCYMRSYSDRRL